MLLVHPHYRVHFAATGNKMFSLRGVSIGERLTEAQMLWGRNKGPCQCSAVSRFLPTALLLVN
jgi:hypothetical protein